MLFFVAFFLSSQRFSSHLWGQTDPAPSLSVWKSGSLPDQNMLWRSTTAQHGQAAIWRQEATLHKRAWMTSTYNCSITIYKTADFIPTVPLQPLCDFFFFIIIQIYISEFNLIHVCFFSNLAFLCKHSIKDSFLKISAVWLQSSVRSRLYIHLSQNKSLVRSPGGNWRQCNSGGRVVTNVR